MRYLTLFSLVFSLNTFSQVDSEGEKIPDPHRVYLGVMAAPEIADTYATTNDPDQEWFIEYVNQFYSPKLSYTTGLDFLFLFNQRITFQTGMHYSNKGSRSKKLYLTDSNGVPYDPESMTVMTNYHYLELPAKINYNTHFNKFKFYFSGGIITGFLAGVNTRNKLFYQNGDIVKNQINEMDNSANRINLSVTLGSGLDLFINSKMSLRIEPSYRISLLNLSSGSFAKDYLWNSGVNFSYVFGI